MQLVFPLPAMRREDSRAKPLPNKVNHGRITSSAVDDRRTERRAADGVNKPNRRTAERDGSNRQPANRQAQPQRRTAEREEQAEGSPTDGNKTARETGDRDAPYRHVPDRDNTPGHSRPHRGRVDTRADVNQRPAADAGARPVLESQNHSLLDARAAHEPRGLVADTLAADSLLANDAEPDGGRTIMDETVHWSPFQWMSLRHQRPRIWQRLNVRSLKANQGNGSE